MTTGLGIPAALAALERAIRGNSRADPLARDDGPDALPQRWLVEEAARQLAQAIEGPNR